MPFKTLTNLAALIFLSLSAYAQAKSDIFFLENIGQIHDQNGKPRKDIDFVLHAADGFSIFIGRNKITYQFIGSTNAQRVEACLVGASGKAQAMASTCEPEAYYENHYYNSKLEGRAHSYKKIIYKNIYPHIDWVLKINQDNTFEYEYFVGELGDARQIKMEYKGAKKVQLQRNGDLAIHTPMGIITEQAPKSYGKNGQPIESQFVLQGNKLSYQTDPYAGALVIDPKVAWATYYGDTTMWITTNLGTAKMCNGKGNIYFAGSTNNLANIATVGSYQQNFKAFGLGSPNNAFYVKMDTNGKRLYATYFSADSTTWANDIETFKDNVYLSGTDFSNHLSTIGSQQISFRPMFTSAPFLAQFDTSGLLNWCTYVGGNYKYNLGVYCFVDIKGDVYATGTCDTINPYIATVGAYKTLQSDSGEAFIVKYNPSGKRVWGTFYGGRGNDFVRDAVYVPTDGSGALYIIGNTTSDTGIATLGAYQTVKKGTNDAMLIKFDTSGRRLWGTYIGDDGTESTHGICQDSKNNIYILGQTNSAKGIATPLSYQSSFAGGNTDVFLMKFNSSGNRQWGTYFGGALADGGGGVCADKWDNIFFFGGTRSTSNIADSAAFQKNNNGLGDGYIAAFKPNGKKFWSSYFGGEGSEDLRSIFSESKNLYLLGMSSSRNINLATKGSLVDTNANGREKGWIVKITEAQIGYTSDTLDPVSISDISIPDKQFTLYPNPNKGSFTISAQINEAVKLVVYDLLGNQLWSKNIQPNNKGILKEQIDLKHLAAGIYSLCCFSHLGLQTIEFVKE